MHPAVAGGPGRQWEEVGRQRVHPRATPVEAHADQKRHDAHQDVVARNAAHQQQHHGAGGVGQRQHPVRAVAVHQPAQHHRTQRPAQLEHRADDGRLIGLHAGVADHGRHPAAQQKHQEQVQEVRQPQHQTAQPVMGVEHDPHGVGGPFHLRRLGHHIGGLLIRAAGRAVLDDAAYLRAAAAPVHQKGQRFRQKERHDHTQQQGHGAPQHEHALPAVVGHQPRRQEPAACCPHREPGKHDGHQQRAARGRRDLPRKGGHHRHDPAHGKTRNETADDELPAAVGTGHQQREQPEQHHAAAQHPAPPETVSQRPGRQGAQRKAHQRRTQHRRQVIVGPAPGFLERRPHEAHDHHIEAVHHHHQEAQQNHPFLPPPHRTAVEQCAHVDGVARRHVCVPPCPFNTQSAPAGAAWRHPSWAARTRTGRPESARTACRCPPDTGSPAPSPPPETA